MFFCAATTNIHAWWDGFYSRLSDNDARTAISLFLSILLTVSLSKKTRLNPLIAIVVGLGGAYVSWLTFNSLKNYDVPLFTANGAGNLGEFLQGATHPYALLVAGVIGILVFAYFKTDNDRLRIVVSALGVMGGIVVATLFGSFF